MKILMAEIFEKIAFISRAEKLFGILQVHFCKKRINAQILECDFVNEISETLF